MLTVAFLGPLASSFAERVHAYLSVPCDFIHTDEKNAVDVLPEVDVLVTLIFTREMGASAKRPSPRHSLSEGRDLASPVHDDRDPGHAAGRHASGDSCRMLLPDG